VTITNLKVTGDGDTMTIPSMVVTGAAARDKGGFTANAISFDKGDVQTADKGEVTWETGRVEGATVPSADEIKAKTHISPFDGIKMTGVAIKGGQLAAPIEIQEINGKVKVDSNGTPTDFNSNFISMKFPLELIDDAQQRAIVQSLGYTGPFVVNIAAEGGYETKSNTLDLRSFVIDTTDVGKIGIVGKFSSLPLSQLADPAKSQQVASTGKLDKFSLRFDNAGIVEKVLDMQAKQSGMKKEEFVAQITGALPFMLNFIGNDAFQKKVADAVTSFLNQPKSITVSVAPSEPIEFTKIYGTAQSAPNTLPDLLGADISANN
jgi:hypothetical protein